MSAPTPRQTRLAERLRQLRAARYRSGSQFALALNWPQPRVSKLETGTQLPTEDDVQAWVTATTGGDEHVLAELLELRSSAQVEYVNNRDAARAAGGIAAAQIDIATTEARATRIGEYQPGMIPGLLQTAGYTRALLNPDARASFTDMDPADVETIVAGRTRRQDVLYQPGRQVHVVLSELALHAHPGDKRTQVEQLDRLVSLSELAAVELSIVPLSAMPILPLSCFGFYDDTVVWVETLTGEQTLHDVDEIAVYLDAFERLRARAHNDTASTITRVRNQLARKKHRD